MKQGWELKTLEDVCQFQNGFAFKSKTFKDEGVPVLRISNIQKDNIDLRRIVFVDPSDYKEDLSKYVVNKGDLLIAMSGATTGKIGFNNTDDVFYLNQRVGKFKPSEQLNIHYLYYFLSTQVEENLKISAGSAQPNLSTQQKKALELAIKNKYYGYPRKITLKKLSKLMNISESTYQFHLAKAEEKILPFFYKS